MKKGKDINRFLHKDPKGRDPFGPPYSFFHRYDYEIDYTQWMDRIDREIEEERNKNNYYSSGYEIEMFLKGILVFLFLSLLFLVIYYL